jgi:serine protease SohB
MEALIAILLFAGKVFIIVLAIVAIVLFIASIAARSQHRDILEIEDLNQHFRRMENHLKSETMSETDWKAEKKKNKKLKKDLKTDNRPKIFVVDFKGDIKASQVESFREEITAILTTAKETDEVVVRLESPGGMVHGYGLAASQMVRIRDRNIPLTACVDKVAASGGYLMACTAHKILCAPFGIVGSVGVVAQVPNFNRLLKKHEIDFKEYTAGEFKRTVSIFGEITPKGEQKFKQELEDTHHLFKNFVHRFRPQLDLHQVATGEHWYGENAKALGLVDEIVTSDAYLTSRSQSHQIYKVRYEKKKKVSEKFSGIMGKALEKAFWKVATDLEKSRLI